MIPQCEVIISVFTNVKYNKQRNIFIPFSGDDGVDNITGRTITSVRITPQTKASIDHLCCFNLINESLAVTWPLFSPTSLVFI